VYARRVNTAREIAHPRKAPDLRLVGLLRLRASPRPAYNPRVARGWESKSVELQQDDARSTKEPKRRLTSEESAIESRKEGLKLSRSRVLEQLRSAENPRYRKILEQALAVLDEQITRLG
jgi:hypothetical protein